MTTQDQHIEFVDGHTVGIDLGTSNSTLSQLNDEGMPVVFENANGSSATSSVILLAEGGRVVVGPPTDRIAQEDPDRVVVAIKREMGNHKYVKVYEDRKMTPAILSSLILMKLKSDAEKTLRKIGNAVITVPYYFNEPCRKATRYAGHIVGLNVIDIINEPSAATLAYAWMKGELGRVDLPDLERTILVYDLGGGTFDVTVVKYTPTHFIVIATDGDTLLGGLDWTRRIVDHVAEQFIKKFGVDPRDEPRAMLALTNACENAKRELSMQLGTTIEFEYHGQPLVVEFTRKEFLAKTADLLQRTRDTTEFVLEHAGIKSSALDDVILVGGSTAMPAVVKMLKELCGRRPATGLDPQLAVAQGAAIHAAILEARETEGKGQMAQALVQRLRSVTATDVNSHSLGVEITNLDDANEKRNHIMIPRNTKLPCSVKQRFVTNVNNPNAVHVRLLEGEASDVDACTYVGDFRIDKLPPNLAVGSPVEVSYSYDARGHIHVSVCELTGNNEASLEIAWDGGLDDTALQVLRKLAQEYTVE